MSKEVTQHDLLFANIMADKEMARTLFKSYFPKEVQSYIDLDTAEFEHLSPKFVNDVLSGYKVCDVLYKTTSKDGEVLLLAHAEHQSTHDEMIAIRTIIYACSALLEYRQNNPKSPLPPILSLVYYNGAKPYAYSMDPMDLFKHVPEKIRSMILKPILIDLTKFTDKDFQNHEHLKPFEILLKHAYDQTTDEKIDLFDDTIREISGSFLRIAVEYALTCIHEDQREQFFKKLSLTTKNEDVLMSIADQLQREGWQKGKQESALEIAGGLLADGFDPKVVAKHTKLDLKTIDRLNKDIQKHKKAA